MPRDITSPRNAKIGYVVLLAVIRYTHGDRHGVVKARRFKDTATRRLKGPSSTHVALKSTAPHVSRAENADFEKSFRQSDFNVLRAWGLDANPKDAHHF